MNVFGKITKTEWLLIAAAALFLCLLVLLYPTAETDIGTTFSITVSRRSAEPVTPEAYPPVDLNTATAEELEVLSGIGPVIARRIVAYREEHGPFAAVEDLLQVSGIGEATLKKISDRVTIG